MRVRRARQSDGEPPVAAILRDTRRSCRGGAGGSSLGKGDGFSIGDSSSQLTIWSCPHPPLHPPLTRPCAPPRHHSRRTTGTRRSSTPARQSASSPRKRASGTHALTCVRRGEKTDDEATGLDSGWREQPDRDPFIDEPVSDDEQSIAEGAERLRAFRLLPLQEQQRINRERALVIGATWQPPTAAEDKANYAGVLPGSRSQSDTKPVSNSSPGKTSLGGRGLQAHANGDADQGQRRR